MKPNLASKNPELKTDATLKSDVLAELKYEPSVKATDIGVVVKEGTLTLNGSVGSYIEKCGAVRAAKRVSGVKAIADDIKVNLLGSMNHNDSDIAAAAATHLKWSTSIPAGTVKIIVREGIITLEGIVDGWYQKNVAENTLKYLAGVKGVVNSIIIKPVLSAIDIKADIKSAFERHALFDANKITVETVGNVVTLRGQVRNHMEVEEAERIAWAAQGVSSVNNKLAVEWNWFSGE